MMPAQSSRHFPCFLLLVLMVLGRIVLMVLGRIVSMSPAAAAASPRSCCHRPLFSRSLFSRLLFVCPWC